MKYMRIGGVLLLLFIFPLISYLYLKFGYNFRYNALQELKPKGQLDSSFNFQTLDLNDTISINALDGKVTLLYDVKNRNSKEMLVPIYEEFEHKSEFNIIGFTDTIDLSAKNLTVEDYKKWKLVVGTYPYEKELSLVDTGLMIRNYYSFDSVSFEKLGQHIPIILPREIEKDVVMKDSKQNQQ